MGAGGATQACPVPGSLISRSRNSQKWTAGTSLIFSCDSAHLAGGRRGAEGGSGPFRPMPERLFEDGVDIRDAELVIEDDLYAGRVVHTRTGPALLGFENHRGDPAISSGPPPPPPRLADPRPIRWDRQGRLTPITQEEVAR